MKAGLTLEELALEIRHQDTLKEDYLVKPQNLRMESYPNGVFLHLIGDTQEDLVEPLTVSQIAHRQIGNQLGIPAGYYDKMLAEDPGLLKQNVNAWLDREPEPRMLRTLGGTARAYLSNRYRRIDHMAITKVVLPIIGQMTEARVESCQITESKMYLKVVNPRLQAEVVPGDIVQSGIIISNSEVGQGSVSIQPLVYRLVCRNGMVVNDASLKRHHVGRIVSTDQDFMIYSEETIAADDFAFVKKIQDTVRAAVDETRFARVVEMMQNASQARMNTADVPGVVKLASKEFHIQDEEYDGVLQHLIEGNQLSLYGLSNAVTRYSQDVDSYDRATKLESIGYDILAMPQRMWNRINQQAA